MAVRRRKSSERISEVFKTVGQPTITYVERESGKLEIKLRNALQTPGQLCLVTGPSKTGKTTLYKRVLEELKLVPLVIRCDKDLSATEFWARALEAISFSRLRELVSENKVESKIVATIGAKLGWSWLAEATGQLSAEAAAGVSDAKAKELVLSQPSPMHLIPALKKLPYVLVVEDYHYLNQEVQRTIFQQWKTFVDEEVSALVLGTAHHAVDVISSNRELMARMLHIEVESWNVEDLKKIVRLGFGFLGADISESFIQRIADESVGLPIITQSICESIFHSADIYDHVENTTVEINHAVIQHAMEETASSKFQSFKQYYDRLILGPRKRARKFDTYELVLSCFALSPIKFGLQKYEIIERLAKLPILAERVPPAGSLNSMLKALTKFQDKQALSLLEWQGDEEKLYILEPCFLYFLRWGLNSAVKPKGESEFLERLGKNNIFDIKFFKRNSLPSSSSEALDKDGALFQLMFNLLKEEK